MMRARLQHIVAASPAVLMALLIARLWFSGTLRYYVNDRTVWIVLLGGVLFAIVGITSLRASMRADHASRISWRTIVFLVPIVFGLLIPAKPLSASSGQSSSLGALQLASHVSSGASGDQFGVWISDLATHPDPTWWAGQHVTLVGFVAGQSGLPKRSFIVGRYLVTCCVVDATLFGFPVQIDRGSVPAEGAWVQVSGVFGRDYWVDPSGQHYPFIHHATIGPVSIPSSPYLSPS